MMMMRVSSTTAVAGHRTGSPDLSTGKAIVTVSFHGFELRLCMARKTMGKDLGSVGDG